MEIGYIANELWRRKRWLAVGLIIATFAAMMMVYEFPSFEKKSLELGAASTEVLVDSEQSPIGNLLSPIDTLILRSTLYSKLLQSSAVKERIADELGISAGLIATQGAQPGDTSKGVEPTPEERGNELVTEGNVYRLYASSAQSIPIVTINSQAKTAEEAARVANAGAAALQSYVRDVQDRQNVRPSSRVELRQLAPARGGVVNQGVNLAAALLAFVGAFGLWCLLVLVTPRVLMGFREGQTAWKDFPGSVPSEDPNGHSPFDAEKAGVGNGSGPADDSHSRTPTPR